MKTISLKSRVLASDEFNAAALSAKSDGYALFGGQKIILYIMAILALLTTHVAFGAQTIVSLTFDDGINQFQVRDILLFHGMKGTFYVNSNLIDSGGGYLTKADLDELVASGNEIGGHTINHVDLATLSDAQQRAAICNDMQTLNTWYPGQIHSFAYPYASSGPTTQSILASGCTGVGTYTNARTVGGLRSGNQCVGCPTAETIPPGNPYYISTPESILSTTTLAQIETLVTQAENGGGGWVPLVFHQVCNNCDLYSISETNLTAFLTWLQAREANNTVVRTVNEVMTGAIPPPPPPPPLGANQVINHSLELDQDGNNQADCWVRDSWGSNTGVWSRTNDAYDGLFAERIQVSSYSNGDLKLLQSLDGGQAAGGCAPILDPNSSYQFGAWYKSTTPVIPVLFYLDVAGNWQYWRDGPLLPISSNWSQMSFNVVAPLPAGAHAVSFGIAIESVGTLTTDSYSMKQVLEGTGDTVAPTVTLTAPVAGTVSGTVNVTANASDNVGVAGVQFRLDGANLGSEDLSAPYSVSWNTATAGNGAHTLTAVARDAAGNSSTSSAVVVTVNNPVETGNLVINPSLELDANNNNVPDCWLLGGYGTNSFRWTRVANAHSGNFAESLQVTSIESGDRKMVQSQDSGNCAPAVTSGKRYMLSAWYQSTESTGFIVFYRTSTGRWTYWRTSPNVSAASNWTQATYITPTIPNGATHISFGLYLSSEGTLVTDDYAMTPIP